jgi:ubiquinone biosynthesis protein
MTASEPRLIPPFGTSPIAFTVVLVLTAIVSGRLLGVRLGLLRRLFAAFIGFIAGFVLLFLQYRTTGATSGSGLIFGIPALLVTMGVLVLMELLARPDHVPSVARGLRPAHPLRTLRGRLRRTRRYSQVLLIAARNGLNVQRSRALPSELPKAQARAAGASLRRALEEAGGAFIKFGQLLSTRRDLLPAEITNELSALQDAATPAPTAEVLALLEHDLRGAPAAVFAEFDATPIAAASIAQAYRATLKDGTRVAVKVQRPGVAASIATDIDILQRLVHRLAAHAAWIRDLRVEDLADGFAVAISEELDFNIEAANLEAMRSGAAAEYGVSVPRPFRTLSTDRVLVMEWLDGVPLREAADAIRTGQLDREALARNLFRCVLRQIFVDGLFHADPHPGNVLLTSDGHVGLIDFGSVGRLNAMEQSALGRILLAVDRRDPARLRDALIELSPVHDAVVEERMERALGEFMARRLGPGMTPGAAFFNDLFRLLVEFRVSLPSHVAAVFRAIVTLEGTVRLLVPSFDLITEARAYAAESLGAAGEASSLAAAVQHELTTQLPLLRGLPRRVDHLLTTAQHEGLPLRVSLFEGARDRATILTIADRGALAFVGATTGAIGTALLLVPGSPELQPGISLLQAIGYAGLVSSAILLLRVIVAVARDRLV